jgi:cell division protein FtsQ
MTSNEPHTTVVASAPPRKRLGKYVMIPLLLSIGVLSHFAREWRSTVKVASISVDGARSMSKSALAKLAGVDLNAPLYGFDLNNVKRRIMAEPLLKDVQLNREYPGSLVIAVSEREPVAALNCGQMRFVDEEGVVLPYLDGDRKLDLPVIIGIDGIQAEKVGKPIMNKELFTALEIIRQAQMLDSTIYHMISELDMNRGGDIRINSLDAGIPVILGRDDIPKKLLLFETFWTNFVNTGYAQKLKYVDLRFEDQVVVKWQDEPASQSKKVTL